MMNVKVIKNITAKIVIIKNVISMVELTGGRFCITGNKVCECCGHIEKVEYNTGAKDTIVVESTKEDPDEC
jgi:hypothetical protein